MKKIIPEKFKKGWLLVFAAFTFLQWMLLLVNRTLVLGRDIVTYELFSLLLLSTVVSLVACTFGFLGARLVFICSGLGAAAGILMMAYYASIRTGWEDLTSLMAYLTMTAGGICLGIVIEIVRAVYKRIRT